MVLRNSAIAVFDGEHRLVVFDSNDEVVVLVRAGPRTTEFCKAVKPAAPAPTNVEPSAVGEIGTYVVELDTPGNSGDEEDTPGW